MATPGKGSAERDVVDLLMSDHRIADELLEKLFASKEDPSRRRALADQLIGHLVRHSVAEETFVYPLMAARLDRGEELVKQDKAFHQEFEEAMRGMEKVEPTDTQFEASLKRLSEAFATHKSQEEKEQFPELRQKVPASDLVSLVSKVEAIKYVAPTHPHPFTDTHSVLQHVTIGPGLGFVDRVRDALTGRTSTPQMASS
jgi:hemerythrin superfamily protein